MKYLKIMLNKKEKLLNKIQKKLITIKKITSNKKINKTFDKLKNQVGKRIKMLYNYNNYEIQKGKII